MTQTAIIGTGMTPVAEHWDRSLRDLAVEAGSKALIAANTRQVDAVFVANSYGSTFNNQTQLGALIADSLGLKGVEAVTIEAGSASGGAALRSAHLAVQSGEVRTALVVGVEKATDIVGSDRVRALNISLDADNEAIHGATLPAMAALLMRRYMYEYQLSLDAFEGFSINAHANGRRNLNAMYRNAIKAGAFAKAPMVAAPVSLFDSAPDGDGAAAVVLTRYENAEDLVDRPVRILASAMATDTLSLQERAQPLFLSAVQKSVEKALRQANLTLSDIHMLELHDAFTILSVLTLEAAGWSLPGEGWKWGSEQGAAISLTGKLPLSTFGGLKSRGNPAGATGVYQAVEAVMQLHQIAGDNQVRDVERVMVQNMGGLGSTVVTHILGL